MTLRTYANLSVTFFAMLHAMSASDPSLHPLKQRLPAGSIEFALHDAACPGEPVAIECVYQPYRERDVIKKRSFHLFDSPFRIGSGLFSVQRNEFHHLRQQVVPETKTTSFSVALQDPDHKYGAYQLASVRILSGCITRLEFGRWFAESPPLDSGFGLVCAKESLSGKIHSGGLGAGPLAGSLPLWPNLRRVELTYIPSNQPRIQLWDPSAKHHWDGWRQATPQHWMGGSSILARHISAPTVWHAHEYSPFAKPESPSRTQPVPPTHVIPGVALEVYWPEGETLEFPEVRFERPVDMLAMPVARLTPRAREILALSATLQPGLEHHSISTTEWDQLDELAVPSKESPIATKMKLTADGKDVMEIQRTPQFTEPLLLLFAAEYGDAKRCSMKSMMLTPTRWTGPLPE